MLFSRLESRLLLAASGAMVICLAGIPEPILAVQPAAKSKAKAEKKPSAEAAADKANTKSSAKEDKRNGRLPPNYGKVLHDDQRDRAMAVQEEFAPKIRQMRADLKALLDGRDAALDKLLSAEQKQQIEMLRGANSKRAKSAPQDEDEEMADADSPAPEPAKPKVTKSSSGKSK